MTSHPHRAAGLFAQRSATGFVVLAVVLGSLGLSGCGIVRAVKKVVDRVESNKATMDGFTNKIESGPTTFEATYVTTGSSPTTVTYAVEPPKGLAFKNTPTATGNGNSTFDFIVNPSGEYLCTPSSTGTSPWQCTKLPKASAADYNDLLDLYTPTHWVDFLKGGAFVAALAGDKVSTSTMTVNGFAMSCVDFTPPQVATSTICTTAENILGYVKVAGTATSFEIKSYSTSPPASLFQLPPGATVTTIPTSVSTTTAP